MQTNLEQFTEIIRALPPEDFDRVREVFNEEEKARREKQKNLIGKSSVIKRRGNGSMKTARNI